MIFIFPASGGFIDRAQQFLPAHLALDDLGQESAAITLSKELIDVTEQTFRQEDMSAFLYHGGAPLIIDQHTLAESAHQSSTKSRLRPITSFMGFNPAKTKMLYSDNDFRTVQCDE